MCAIFGRFRDASVCASRVKRLRRTRSTGCRATRMETRCQWIAYTTDETGQPNVYVQPFLRAGGKHRISPNGGRNPRWRADGRELFYLDATGTMTAVPIDLTASSPAGLAKTLFPAGAVSIHNMYAVSRDGQRFLVNKPQNAATATPLTVIVNWTSTLQK